MADPCCGRGVTFGANCILIDEVPQLRGTALCDSVGILNFFVCDMPTEPKVWFVICLRSHWDCSAGDGHTIFVRTDHDLDHLLVDPIFAVVRCYARRAVCHTDPTRSRVSDEAKGSSCGEPETH